MFGTSGQVQFIGGYHEYNGGCSIHWRDKRMHVGRYREYTWDVQYIRVFNINQKFLSIFSFTCIIISFYVLMVLNTLRFTHDISRKNHDIPPMYWTHIILDDYLENCMSTLNMMVASRFFLYTSNIFGSILWMQIPFLDFFLCIKW